ncbi:hypothetical protein T4C_9490 [Trichinella pseudospiralis]|uniref:Uncharacterized protein n=1 Tax=Trichinella pseudospiralis TaxID=6337 RepID=A0A0V1JU15_TRIPS|nr:hypothetical protein T4C_9490 [Trichinella pseudospiralis]
MPCKVLSEIAMLWNKWPINFSALPALQNAEWMMMMIDLLKENLNYDYHGYHYGCSDNLACPSTI